MLEKLVLLCQTFGSGALATRCHVQAASLVPHRICSLRTLGPIWLMETVAIVIVSGALLAVGTTVALAYEGNPTIKMERLCQLQLVFLDHSGLSVRKLQIL